MKTEIVVVSKCCDCGKHIFQILHNTKLATISRLMTEVNGNDCYCKQCYSYSKWEVGIILHIKGAAYL